MLDRDALSDEATATAAPGAIDTQLWSKEQATVAHLLTSVRKLLADLNPAESTGATADEPAAVKARLPEDTGSATPKPVAEPALATADQRLFAPLLIDTDQDTLHFREFNETG